MLFIHFEKQKSRRERTNDFSDF